MSIIYMKKWVLSDLERIKKQIYNGNKSRKLPKRALHIQNILAMFAKAEANRVHSNNYQNNLWKPYIFPPLDEK